MKKRRPLRQMQFNNVLIKETKPRTSYMLPFLFYMLSTYNLFLQIVITEYQALLLLSSKLTFRGVVLLKMALDHIPLTVSVIPRGTTIPLCLSFAKQILEKNGVKLSEAEVQIYARIAERCCSVFCTSFKFELDDSLWELTGEGVYHYNRFIVPPVESCLHCDNALAMNNMPSKAIVYGTTGPLPATKVTLCCNRCKTSYGIAFCSDEKGKHLYPKKHESPLWKPAM